jgi:putative ABC transport system permease protein
MVSALDRKLLRDLWRLRAQVLTVAVVIAFGVSLYVGMGSSRLGLQRGAERFFARQRLADVFVSLARAPLSVAARVEALPGVALVVPRVTERGVAEMPAMPEPAVLTAHSLPDGEDPPLNALHLTRGRLPEPGRGDECVVSEAFAQAHHLRVGAPWRVVLGGAARSLRVVGTATSPEYVVPGSLDVSAMGNERYAVIWLRRAALAPLVRMEGAFNDLALRVLPGANVDSVVDAVDEVLRPYGGTGARPAHRHPSRRALAQEIAQLEQSGSSLPMIFLGVAGFLVNVVLGRLVRLQRGQVATLKALGYGDRRIGLHYVEMAVVVVGLGVLTGATLGGALATAFIGLYAEFFRIPDLRAPMDLALLSRAGLFALTAGVVGALGATRAVVALPPAQAMQPEAPPRYGHGWVEALVAARWLGPAARMVLRELLRRPLRLALSSLGIAMSVAILVAGRGMLDAMPFLEDAIFGRGMRDDLAVRLLHPVDRRDARSLRTLPGVLEVETQRTVAVRARAGSRWRDIALVAHPDGPTLRPVLDRRLRRVGMVPGAVVLSAPLLTLLDVRVGDRVLLEPQEGARRPVTVVVGGVADEMFGLQAHALDDDVHRWLHIAPQADTALLRVDPARQEEVVRRLARARGVASVSSRATSIEKFRAQSGRSLGVTMVLLAVFAGSIAAGVVYNNARVALEVRARDLASLRVLGFTQSEVGGVLLGEMFVQVFLGIPPGLLLGRWFSAAAMANTDPEMYRLTVEITARTDLFAIAVTLVAAGVSGWMVRRRVAQLDLVGVLKTRE